MYCGLCLKINLNDRLLKYRCFSTSITKETLHYLHRLPRCQWFAPTHNISSENIRIFSRENALIDNRDCLRAPSHIYKNIKMIKQNDVYR